MADAERESGSGRIGRRRTCLSPAGGESASGAGPLTRRRPRTDPAAQRRQLARVDWGGRPGRPVQVSSNTRASAHGAQRAVQHPCRRLPDGHEHDQGAAGRDDHRLELLRARVRVHHVRFPGPVRNDLRRVERPILALLDPETLEPLATSAAASQFGPGRDPFTDFSGGGYFFLDDQDRAVMPTSERHVFVIAQAGEPDFQRVEDYDLNGAVAPTTR